MTPSDLVEAVRLARHIVDDYTILPADDRLLAHALVALVEERDAAIARAARAEAALVEAEAKRDKAAALAETYRRDWYDAKAEFQANCDKATAPWRRENETLRANCDRLSSENASLASQNESMAMRIESLAEELAKPEDVRLREVVDALDGRAVIFDGLGERVGHLLDEMDEWIARAGEAERLVDAARRRLDCVAESMTEHAYQELASTLEAPPEG